MFEAVISEIRRLFNTSDFIPLHEPKFLGNERKYVNECIDSTFVSSVGKFVDRIEEDLVKYTGAKYCIAVVNGTSALHIALKAAGVEPGSEVITQPFSFVATANAIAYLDAAPIFLDVDKNDFGLSPKRVKKFLEDNAEQKEDGTYNKVTGKKITACVPVHIFGHPCQIDQIVDVCNEFNIPVVEDAAESIGSFSNKQHTGTFGSLGVLSFNGNKTITAGGGGAIITNDEEKAHWLKYVTTTAKKPHKWEYYHDMLGYNYRMPNINAALIVAQLEQLDTFVENKRALANCYEKFFQQQGIAFHLEPEHARSNYWLNAVVLNDRKERDQFLGVTNAAGVMTRPAWNLLNELPMYAHCQTDDLTNARWLEDRVVNIPSSVRV